MMGGYSDIKLFRVRKEWNDIKSQAGAFLLFENALEVAKKSKLNIYNHKKECVWNYKEEIKNGKIQKPRS